MRLSSIVKSAKCLWDLSLHPEGKHITFEKCQDTLRCGRPPLTSPDQMAKELRKKAFTDSADLAALASLYRDGFAHALDTYRAYDRDGSLSFMDLNWGTAQLPTLRRTAGRRTRAGEPMCSTCGLTATSSPRRRRRSCGR